MTPRPGPATTIDFTVTFKKHRPLRGFERRRRRVRSGVLHPRVSPRLRAATAAAMATAATTMTTKAGTLLAGRSGLRAARRSMMRLKRKEGFGWTSCSWSPHGWMEQSHQPCCARGPTTPQVRGGRWRRRRRRWGLPRRLAVSWTAAARRGRRGPTRSCVAGLISSFRPSGLRFALLASSHTRPCQLYQPRLLLLGSTIFCFNTPR